MGITDMKLQAGKELTETEIYDRDVASKNLIANGYAGTGDNLDDARITEKITDILDSGGTKEDVRQFMEDSGASETEIEYHLDTIDESYDK